MLLFPLILQTFLAGLLSALSMPLGAMTSLVWHPSKRIDAMLMAFGGGALLAALFLDLVNEAKDKGHIWELVVGTTIGSVLFTVMDRLVNQSGGFLRKPSTTLVHLSQEESKRFRQQIQQLKRFTLFQQLEPETYQSLSAMMLIGSYEPGTLLYRAGDPSETLYLIHQGEVELSLPDQGEAPATVLSANDSFGRLAFITGCSHASSAIVTRSARLAILSRSEFEELMRESPRLVENTRHYLQSQEIADYLTQRGLAVSDLQPWVTAAQQSLEQSGLIPEAIPVEDHQDEFLQRLNQIQRLPIFSPLAIDDRQEFADRLIFKQAADGFLLFQPGDFPDRLFILATVEVQVVYPASFRKPPLILAPNDVVGELSFITGTKHTVTAIAKTDITYWVIRRQAFEELVQKSSQLRDNIATFLKQSKPQQYLETRHNLESTKVNQWTEEALTEMNATYLIPSAAAIT